jgi:hypothetical protein
MCALAQVLRPLVAGTRTAGRPGRRASTPSAQRAYAWLVGWHERGHQVPKRAEHRQFGEALCAIEPEIAQASRLAREFLGLVHRRDVGGFARWLTRARDTKAPEIRRFAVSLAADLPAVRAAFESSWSSGQAEGQINQLKFLKRQMYGRAKLDLLRARSCIRTEDYRRYTKCAGPTLAFLYASRHPLAERYRLTVLTAFSIL